MRRIVIHRPGSFERLTIESFTLAEPAPSHVRIAVRAIGINFADCIIRMGLYASAKELVGWPITPGFEVAGEIEAVGSDVTDLKVGDRVIGVTLFNGYATHLDLKHEQVFLMPADWSFAAAAGFPTVFLTAWWALFELAHPRPGARILVHSAAGGVGQALCQLGKIAQCEVAGVVGGAHKVAAAQAAGAHEVIDKSSTDLWHAARRFAPKGFDVVLDANGAETLKASYQYLGGGGKLVIYGFHTMFSRGGAGKPNWLKLGYDWLRTPRFDPMKLTEDNKSVLAFNLSFIGERVDALRQAMRELLDWGTGGRVQPLPVTPYPFEQVAQAHRDIESGRTTGKLVLTL